MNINISEKVLTSLLMVLSTLAVVIVFVGGVWVISGGVCFKSHKKVKVPSKRILIEV